MKATMRQLIVILMTLLFWVSWNSLTWPDPRPGEPGVELLPIQSNCCHHQDCVPEPVKVVGSQVNGQIPVEIEGHRVRVDESKFSPVPSAQTRVCYVNPNGEISNKNIRCILYPRGKGGTV
jgi:hypothetical protein